MSSTCVAPDEWSWDGPEPVYDDRPRDDEVLTDADIVDSAAIEATLLITVPRDERLVASMVQATRFENAAAAAKLTAIAEFAGPHARSDSDAAAFAWCEV